MGEPMPVLYDPKRVFVYGKEVADFLAVDYNRIFSTGISAMQELSKQVQALRKSEARVAELEQKVSRLAEPNKRSCCRFGCP